MSASIIETSITRPEGFKQTRKTKTVYPDTFEICEDFPRGFSLKSSRLHARIVASHGEDKMITTVLRIRPEVARLLVEGQLTLSASAVFGTPTEPGRVLRQLFTSCKIGLFHPDVKFRVELCTDQHPFLGNPQSQPAH